MNKDQQNQAPRGLLAMFGGSIPKKLESTITKTSTINGDGNKKTEISTGGGAMKRSSTRKERRSLAAKAQQPGRTVTVSTSPAEIKQQASSIMNDDDDVTMGGTGKKKQKKRFSPYNSRQRAQHVQIKQSNKPIEKIDILVAGFVPGSENNVVPYLQQKSKKEWLPLDVQFDQGQMLLSVDGPVIAHAITRLNGYIFGTQPLQIRLFNQTSDVFGNAAAKANTPKTTTTIDTLREFLRSRWNAEGNYLNLDDMASDPTLKKAQIRPPGANNASATVGPALMKLAGEMFENVVSISFAKNRFRNVQQISTLTQFLPSIQNLSLEDNVITSFSGLDAICGAGKLKHLREIILRGNPVRESEYKQRGDGRGYIRNAVKQFPSLVLLDGVPISLSDEERELIQKTRRVLPLASIPYFFDNQDSQKAAYDFLTRFLQLFDTDRAALVAIYDQAATFSVSTLLKLRSVKKARGRQKQRQMEDDDAKISWTDVNRNLAKKSKGSTKHLYSGPEMIGTVLQKLPTTIHDLSQPKDFVVDAFQQRLGQHGVLQVALYGEFKEGTSKSKGKEGIRKRFSIMSFLTRAIIYFCVADNPLPYSFDRTFLLLPALPGSPAAAVGSPYTVLSDMLYVRDYCSIASRMGSE
ncbi:hypothetical protein BDB00DRAFT_860212 [Zychaea mexicana]|uniref:uncharacterized protein n=1 Tax=Zychaea mexicana TaxID=64656 RepID=UPI0022FEEEDD|nr:uncharacterized protein BDB00DRAFT_860212 [Zychaea mexicana]KAI9474847.1 hypothetical protein BDB00DRAFT_860212 [Zychaea mexicana]